MEFSFKGKRVLVTGGAGGLGSTIVQKFYESGATVYALDCSQPQLDELNTKFPDVIPVLADLGKWDEVGEIVKRLGPMDHLVNNAAVGYKEPIPDATEDILDQTFSVNFKAIFNLSQVFAKNAIANSTQGATIVNVSSILALKTCTGMSAYCCSKAALEMLNKCLALELGVHGIRVNSVLPTMMQTPMSFRLHEDMAAFIAQIVTRTPLMEPLETVDAANLVLYLSSPYSKMITGAGVPIDGGFVVI